MLDQSDSNDGSENFAQGVSNPHTTALQLQKKE